MIRDIRQIQESTLWEDTGKQIAARGKAQDYDGRKIVILVLGDRAAGKSSLIKVLKNDFDPQTKPNSLIEYWPCRMGKEKKQMVHFYEIGSKGLLSFVSNFSKESCRICCLICADLTKGGNLIATVSEYLSKLRQAFGQRNEGRVSGESHEDGEFITDMPIQTSIVGCKFDLFEKLDPQSKKWISRSLRYLAHTNSCSVLSCSNKNSQLSLTLRATFQGFLFDAEFTEHKTPKDINKSMFIRFGQDRIEDMSLPSSGSMSNIEVLEKQLQSTSKIEQKQKPKKLTAKLHAGKLEDALEARRKQLFKYGKKGQEEQSESKELIELI